MKTINSIGEVLGLPGDLRMFILESCPWMAEEWQPENIGYVFVLDDRDINDKSINLHSPTHGRGHLLSPPR